MIGSSPDDPVGQGIYLTTLTATGEGDSREYSFTNPTIAYETNFSPSFLKISKFNEAEKQKLIQIISQGSQVLGEVEDLRSGLKDTVKAIAEELELKPALINKAISVAHRGNYQNIADDMDTLESILNSAGKL